MAEVSHSCHPPRQDPQRRWRPRLCRDPIATYEPEGPASL